MKQQIKKLFKNISKYLGELMLIIGAGLFIYNLFELIERFSIEVSSYTIKEGSLALPPLPELIERNLASEEVYNFSFGYYSNETLLLITFGAMLIVSGLLIIRHKTK